jgi:outer membrane protein assembly factor BamB
VEILPGLPVQPGWSVNYQASQAFTSPAVVAGQSVLAGSADGHLYSVDRLGGNQRWRLSVGAPIDFAPAVLDNVVYVATRNGGIFALENQGNSANILWEEELQIPPSTGFNIGGDVLFIGGMTDGAHRLIAVDREDGDILREFPTTGNYLHYPAIGDQLIYVGDEKLWALDVHNGEEIWSRGTGNNVSAPPLYTRPGVVALAELYMADEGERLYALDANTGRELWNREADGLVTGLAADDSRLFASGNSFVMAVDRDDGERLWGAGVAGPVLGGPIVDGERILVVTQNGSVQFLEAASGGLLDEATLPNFAVGAAAVSGEWIFVPAEDGGMYAFRQAR